MELKFIIESLLFTAQQPVTPKDLRDYLVQAAEQAEEPGVKDFKKTPIDNITAALEELAREHEAAGRSYRLVCVAGAWQFASQPEFAPWIKALVGHKNRPPRLSAPALETLAIIAYRQPITRAEIEQVRGVAVDGVMQTLLERGIVEGVGRAEVVGRPHTYGTTPAFLEYFGLKNLEDLPAADELRRIPISKPDALLTVDPGLATAPPEQLQQSDLDTVENSASPSAAAEATNGEHAAHAENGSTPAAAVVATDPQSEAGIAEGTAPEPQPRNRLKKKKSREGDSPAEA